MKYKIESQYIKINLGDIILSAGDVIYTIIEGGAQGYQILNLSCMNVHHDNLTSFKEAVEYIKGYCNIIKVTPHKDITLNL